MSRKQYRLNSANTSFPIDLDFMASHIAIDNPTASPVFVRIGAPDTPTEINADIYVAAGESKSYPVHARSFAIAFGNPSSLASPSTSGLFTTAIATLYSEDEQLPAYGSASFLSLSISDLTAGLVVLTNPTTVSSVFDIGAWGGAIIHVSLNAGSGQANVLIEISNSPASGFRTFQILSAWPLIPLTITMPRVARYFRVTVSNAAIPAQPVVAGVYSVRATLAEITSFAYQVTGAVISNVYNVANVSETSYILATAGLPSITIALRETGGSGSYGQIIVETSTAVGGPWTFVNTREQNISVGSAFASLYRTYGTLGAFTRVRLLNDGVAGPIIGFIDFSISQTQDLASVLNNILDALGDRSEPVSAGQNIYSILLFINQWLANIAGYTDGLESLVTASNVQLSAINLNTDTLETLIAASNVQLTAIQTNTDQVETQLTTLHTDIGATNTLVASTNTKLDTLIAKDVPGSLVIAANVVTVAGVYFDAGALTIPTWYIEAAALGYNIHGPLLPDLFIQLALGTAGAPVQAFYGAGGEMPEGSLPPFDYTGQKTGGLLIGAGLSHLWVFCSHAAAISLNITMRAP